MWKWIIFIPSYLSDFKRHLRPSSSSLDLKLSFPFKNVFRKFEQIRKKAAYLVTFTDKMLNRKPSAIKQKGESQSGRF